MPKDDTSPYESLERIFHEPKRLAIMSALCAADEGLPFTGLRDACGLTDGNLNRHLKVLDAAGVLRIKKVFVDAKPRTTVALSKKGLNLVRRYSVSTALCRMARGTRSTASSGRVRRRLPATDSAGRASGAIHWHRPGSPG